MKHIAQIGCFLFILCMQPVFAACSILTSGNQEAAQTSDPIYVVLHTSETCPTQVLAFRDTLKTNGLQLEPTMVANRGFHNPSEGSFSLFEIVSGTLNKTGLSIQKGDFFFGHFVTANNRHQLTLDQTPAKNALMIEAFAWDPGTKQFQFYELRGNGKQGQWYYRGNSTDIMLDNTLLHRQPDPANPQFGDRLRCSACHSAGGPIMKELSEPHNDWWEPVRKLDVGDNVPDQTLLNIMDTLVPASKLTESVIAGIKKMEDSPAMSQAKQSASLQELLRPLFCPVELNLMSDTTPNDLQKQTITIPDAFFVDSHFNSTQPPVTIARKDYQQALAITQSHFPETNDNDADHAWLTPVKAYSDEYAIDELVKQHIIDEKFVYDVLNIDMTNPTISTIRCSLLKLVPDQRVDSGTDWKTAFEGQLANSPNPAAQQLLRNMTDSKKTKIYYQNQAAAFLKQCQIKLRSAANVLKAYQLLVQRRAEVKLAEISKNPRGQILEPGFRVIFPETNMTTAQGEWSLNQTCDVVHKKCKLMHFCKIANSTKMTILSFSCHHHITIIRLYLT